MELIQIKDKIEANHKILVKDLESSLEQYMKKLPESPLSLPIKTKIIIIDKKVTIDHIMILPTDNTIKLYEIVFNYFKNLGDEIVKLDEDTAFVIFKQDEDINSQITSKKIQVTIEKDSKIISSGLCHGQDIYLKGSVMLKSDQPKCCITYDFANNVNSLVKYFSCENCSLNCMITINIIGICKECTDTCHKGHNVKLFKDAHVLTWACCYCYKKCCMIKNNKN